MSSAAITERLAGVIEFDVDVSAFGVETYEAYQSIMCVFNCINISVAVA